MLGTASQNTNIDPLLLIPKEFDKSFINVSDKRKVGNVFGPRICCGQPNVITAQIQLKTVFYV